MEELKINPDEFNPADSSLNMEGVGEAVEVIQEAYQSEPFQQPLEEQEEEVNQLAVQQRVAAQEGTNVTQSTDAKLREQMRTDPSQPAPSTQPVQTAPTTAAEVLEQGTSPQLKNRKGAAFGKLRYDEDGLILEEDLVDINGRAIPKGVIEKLKLRHDWNPKEAELRKLFDDAWNLESQLKAFQLIRSDPELTARYDHNGDGEITYDDFHDTTNLNGGAGMTDEEDAIATQEWLEALTSKSGLARAKAVWQDTGPGQNMARYINLRRMHALAPQENIDMGEDWRQASAGGLLDLSTQLVGAVGSVGQILQGQNPFTNSTLDDNLFQHKNENSLEYLVNHNISRLGTSQLAYEGSYWIVGGLMTAGAGSIVGGGLKGLGAVTKLNGLARTGTFIQGTTGISGSGHAKGMWNKVRVKPAAKFLGYQKFVQAANMSKDIARISILDSIPLSTFANLQEDGWGNMKQDGLIQQWVQQDANANAYGPLIAQGINTPLFQQADFMFTEFAYGFGAVGALGALGKTFRLVGKAPGMVANGIPKIPGKIAQWNPANNKQLMAGTKDWSNWIGTKWEDNSVYFDQMAQGIADAAQAGRVQLRKFAEGTRNPFADPLATEGEMSSVYGAWKNGEKLLGQGVTRIRSGVRKAFNDLDQIRHTIGFGRKGSPRSQFSPLDEYRFSKAGIEDPWWDDAAESFYNDEIWKAQVLDGDITRGINSDSALRGIQETLGRDAGSLEPREFWGDAFVDQPLNPGNWETLSDIEKWAIKNVEIADTVNRSLLLNLRDQAMATGEMLGKTDVFATDGAVRRIANNLTIGLGNVKKTQFTWNLARRMMEESGGEMTQEMMIDIAAEVAKNSSRIHKETKDGINLMVKMLKEEGNDELVGAILDVFKVSNDVHNWKDFDAWMHQKIVGGEFNGKVKTGAMVRELQQVMINSMLSGPKTPLRAIIGTTVNSYLNVINEAFGSIMRQPFTNDVISRKASVAKMKGMFELIPEALEVFQKNWHGKWNADFADIRTRYTEPPTKGDIQWESERVWTELRGTDSEKAAMYLLNTGRNLNNNKLLSWSPRALAATDDTFRWLLARSRSKEKAMRQVLEETGDDFTKITPEVLKKAEDIHYNHLLDPDGNINLNKDAWLKHQFEEVTLTSELKGFAAKLDDVFNSAPLVKPFYLFARTGINGLNLTFKNTPLLGAMHKESIDILRHTGDDFTKLQRYGIHNAEDLANARNLFTGRQAVGSAVTLTMAGMYMGGQLTGNGPADRQLRQNWINAGWKPNHLYIGDVGFDYRSIEPFNVIWSSIADIGDNMELMGSEWAEKRLQAVSFVIGRGLTGKTYMSGLDQMMQIMQMKPGAFNKAGADILNNSIPLAGMRNEFGKWINPHMKELNSSMWDSIRNKNKASELLAINKLPDKHDILNGKPINNWNIIGRSFNAVSPIQLDIRNDTPGRRLLLDSNYDLKSTTYSGGGYSLVKDARVRSYFQNEIGNVPITIGSRKFKNVEEALGYLATRKDVINSMQTMRANTNNPANYDINPETYPHNTLIDNVMNQARAKAWARLNLKTHPAYVYVQKLKSEKDGKDSKTRDNREEILNLSFPTKKIPQFPKAN